MSESKGDQQVGKRLENGKITPGQKVALYTYDLGNDYDLKPQVREALARYGLIRLRIKRISEDFEDGTREHVAYQPLLTAPDQETQGRKRPLMILTRNTYSEHLNLLSRMAETIELTYLKTNANTRTATQEMNNFIEELEMV